MSTVVLVEQRPPFILMLASRVPTYTQIIISLLAVLLFQAFPSWAIAKPPVRNVIRKRRSASLTSNATTLVDPDEVPADKKDINEQEKEKRHHVSFSDKNPFNRFGSSVKMALARSKSMKPRISRRLTLPARRFSTHIVTALHNLTPHCRPQENVDSYFSLEKNNAEDITMAEHINNDIPVNSTPTPHLVSVIQTTRIETVEGDTNKKPYVTAESPRKRKTLKQAVRRASVIFGDIVRR